MSDRWTGRMATRTFIASIGMCVLAWAVASPASAGNPSLATSPQVKSRDASSSNYTVYSPAKTNTNIQGVVLACESVEGRSSLQMHLYVRNDDRLLPNDRPTAMLKASPGASIYVDDQAFPSNLLFADRYAALSDRSGPDRSGPDRSGSDLTLSHRLITALLDGKVMVLRFDLLQETASLPAGFDGEATIALTAQAPSLSRTVEQCIEAAMS